MDRYDAIVAALPQIAFFENERLSSYTSFRIGGPARLIAQPTDETQLAQLLRAAQEQEITPRILGGGSNILVPDEGVDALVIRLCAESAVTINAATLTASAGCNKAVVANAAANAGLAGLEFAHGIPGTIGGGVRMNAGAYGGEMAQVVTRVRAMDLSGNIREFTASELDFSYRHSFFTAHPDYIVLSAAFTLTPDDPDAIRDRMRDLMTRRRDKQPLEYPSAGSVFKRPEGYFAGKLIEDSELKGFSIGGAQVSEKHAGFIINRGGATAADVHDLVRHIQNTVLARFGVSLECEIEMW